mgnify:FL=1
MKKTYLIAGAMVLAAIYLLTTATKDLSVYASFADAARTGHKAKVAGQLVQNKEMYYNPEKDPNYFSFFVRDSKGEERKVVLLSEKPQDFEMSEQIVLTGKMKGEEFIASEVLLKCPSKYKDEEIYIKGKKS